MTLASARAGPRARLPDLSAAVIDVATTASRTLHSI
ncbi:hypothetical protein H4W81_003150 [Nonomuraea africana]|uniref:Uncharacterized protein n=1 Tax=Nonomuraea africana TaxID=46171 RepID=A0ABR9KEB2_9ACTN|nr:hypothetical protein [Nonomuraea africana]